MKNGLQETARKGGEQWMKITVIQIERALKTIAHSEVLLETGRLKV